MMIFRLLTMTEYRRGRETTWTVYGEEMGVLSGDAYLNYAYEVALSGFDPYGRRTEGGRALRFWREKSGLRGMLGGQSADVVNEGKTMERASSWIIFMRRRHRRLWRRLYDDRGDSGRSVGRRKAQVER